MPALPTALTGQVGDSIIVKSNARDVNGRPSSSVVVWSSDNTALAIVQSIVGSPGSAVINCIAAGVVTITATAGSASAEFDLTIISITPGTATSIDVASDFDFQTLKKG